MKTILSVAAVAVLAFTMGSCKKDWTCSCTVSGFTIPTTLSNQSKSDATSKCNSIETTDKMADPNASCSLN